MARPQSPGARVAALGILAALAAAGCVQVGTGTGDPTSSGSSSSTPMPASGVGDGDAGTSCGTDTQTGTVLCLGVVTCPEVAFDPKAWPGCGFRVTGGKTLDLECLCNGDSLCPVGVAATCDQAASLLAAQTQLAVCQQVSEQRCVSVAPQAAAPAAPDAGGGVPSTCNQTCLTGCGAAADCLQICGC